MEFSENKKCQKRKHKKFSNFFKKINGRILNWNWRRNSNQHRNGAAPQHRYHGCVVCTYCNIPGEEELPGVLYLAKRNSPVRALQPQMDLSLPPLTTLLCSAYCTWRRGTPRCVHSSHRWTCPCPRSPPCPPTPRNGSHRHCARAASAQMTIT